MVYLGKKLSASEIIIAKNYETFWTIYTSEEFFIADLSHDVLKF